MAALTFDQDHTKIILSQLKDNLSALNRGHQSYLQVNYLHRNIEKVNPEQAEHHQKSTEEENLRDYIDQSLRDRHKYLKFQHDLKSKFFRTPSQRPPVHLDTSHHHEPIDMIKSFSQHQPFFKRQQLSESNLVQSLVSSSSLKHKAKARYSNEIQGLLQRSQIITRKKNKYKLVGGTMMEKEKLAEEVMRQEKKDILQIIKGKDYSQLKREKVQDIPNKQKFSLNFLDYMKQKTKSRLDRHFYEQKIRKPHSKLEKFQEFILEEGKFRSKAKEQLSSFYIKMREEFRRIEPDSLHKQQLLKRSRAQ